MFDCIINARPSLPSKKLIDGQIGTYYDESIQASVENAPNDDSFIYHLSIDEGLPPGISYYQEGRRIILTGTPSSIGTYTFRVSLTIDYPEATVNGEPLSDSNNICFGNDSTYRNYTIVVQ